MKRRRAKRAADLARLEAKIDRLLSLLDRVAIVPTMPVYPSPYYPYGLPPVITGATTGTLKQSNITTEIQIDGKAIMTAIEPYITADVLAARKAKP